MVKRKQLGPSSFREWVVGTTIPTVLGPIPKKEPSPPPSPPPKRDLFRLEMSTDDEAEEDSIKITYPRTNRSQSTLKPVPVKPKPITTKTTTTKKVRFEESPRKSALKKTKVTKVESEGEITESDDKTVSESDQTATSQESTSDAESPIPDSSAAESSEAESTEEEAKPVKQKSKHKKKAAKISSTDTESGEDSEPNPTSKNSSAKKSKQKNHKAQKVQKKKEGQSSGNSSGNEGEGETSESAETSEEKTRKPKKKTKKPRQTESQEKQSETEGSKTQGPKQKQGKSSNQDKKSHKDQHAGSKQEKQRRANKKKKKVVEESNDDEADDEAENDVEDKSTGEEDEEEHVQQPKASKKVRTGKSKAEPAKKHKKKKASTELDYPAAFTGPYPGHPNTLEPVRAEVLQTERVIETPEDPQPNAYYDRTANVVRVYHGPVYSNHQGHGLYPSRNALNRPLPVGMPHPTQNPYFDGFNNTNQLPQHQPGYEHVPVTHGMTSAPWPATYAPHEYPPQRYQFQPYPPATTGPPKPPSGSYQVPPRGAWDNLQQPSDQSPMMSGANGHKGPPSSKDKDKAGVNNVVPEPIKASRNPYIPERKSLFSAFGSNEKRTTSLPSRKSAKEHQKDGVRFAKDYARDPNERWPASRYKEAAPPRGAHWQGDAPYDTWGTTNGLDNGIQGSSRSSKESRATGAPDPEHDQWGQQNNTSAWDNWGQSDRANNGWGQNDTTNDNWGQNDKANDSWGQNDKANDNWRQDDPKHDTWGQNDQTNDAWGQNDPKNDEWGQSAKTNDSWGQNDQTDNTWGQKDRTSDKWGSDSKENDQWNQPGNDQTNDDATNGYLNDEDRGSNQAPSRKSGSSRSMRDPQSNVTPMPGSWVDNKTSDNLYGPAPTWGDHSMAADTNGQAAQW